jgi:hypothetical protein
MWAGQVAKACVANKSVPASIEAVISDCPTTSSSSSDLVFVTISRSPRCRLDFERKGVPHSSLLYASFDAVIPVEGTLRKLESLMRSPRHRMQIDLWNTDGSFLHSPEGMRGQRRCSNLHVARGTRTIVCRTRRLGGVNCLPSFAIRMVLFDIVDPAGLSSAHGVFCSITSGGLAFCFPLSLVYASRMKAGTFQASRLCSGTVDIC